ncbi:hypothetical protein JX265_000896 [Neoarthrinium moseri]|uniref:Thaumatin-like protein n=1 Tax=Neoarthrinium moseri TaxID=1658444 RepID=A0A9P9WX45_9PEZI|nr:uncharacterized protein JN550_006998 [Neoarthrinium moseri]KAI1867267.1 hypothetical protein JN550_006998 [Neoarthrinium moseri]KAI1880656.1 hypothetical protein JX265_000896 [Neoarthrinium moseri]
MSVLMKMITLALAVCAFALDISYGSSTATVVTTMTTVIETSPSVYSSTLASPTISRRSAPTIGEAICGALDTACPHGNMFAAVIPTPPPLMTISIVNQAGAPISTLHASNVGGPSIVSGINTTIGTMAAGATAAIAVPTGWAGNIQIGLAKHKLTGDVSQIEANFVIPPDNGITHYTFAVPDIDVSYVNGYSLSMTCSCNGVRVTGCTKDLFALNKCPNHNGQGACANPTRPFLDVKVPTAFFAPCVGEAYTFPDDGKANSFGECQNGTITCCVGNKCP